MSALHACEVLGVERHLQHPLGLAVLGPQEHDDLEGVAKRRVLEPVRGAQLEEGALARAAADKRPLVVDFTAAWCGACKELDKKTFSEPRVGQELGRFVAVKVDATNNDDPKVEAMLARFKVVGLPTVVMFDSRGKEAARFNDFVPPDEFLKSAQAVN